MIRVFAATAGSGWVLLIVSAVSSGCVPAPAAVAPMSPPEVTVAQPLEEALTEHYETTGRVAAIDVVEIRPRVMGYLTEVAFTDGQKVAAGDVLFKIDPRPFEATLAQAKAQVQSAEARLAKGNADVARQQDLFDKKIAPRADLDLAIAERDTSLASKALAEAQVTSAALDLEYSTIIAPISGKISVASVRIGNLVGPLNTTGGPLTTIIATQPIYVYANIDERMVLKLREQMVADGESHLLGGAGVKNRKLPFTVQPESATLPPQEGVLDFVDNQVDPKTGTIRVRAVFPNDPELLTDGMFVRASMPWGKPRTVLTVPERAIGTNLGAKFLYVVDADNKARRIPVRLGMRSGSRVEVIPTETGGLSLTKDSRIIIAGLQRVREGAPVKPDEGTATAAK